MSTFPNYAASVNSNDLGVATLLINDYSRTTPTNYQTLVTAGSNGTRVDDIDIEVGGSSLGSSVILWIYNGSTFTFFKELLIPARTVSSGSTVSYSVSFSSVSNANNWLPIFLQSGQSIVSTITTSNIILPVSNTSLSGNTTPITTTANSPIPMSTAGTAQNGITYASVITIGAATTTNTVAGAQNPGANTFLSLASYPYVINGGSIPGDLVITNSGSTATTLTVRGQDFAGRSISFSLSVSNGFTYYALNCLGICIIDSIFSSAAATSISVGIQQGVQFLNTDGAYVTFTSAVNNSASTIYLQGVTINGSYIRETLTGPNNSTVTSANKYKYITALYNSVVNTSLAIGTSAFISPVYVSARGADL